jgi:hypothetical protein
MNQFITNILLAVWLLLHGGNVDHKKPLTFTSSSIAAVDCGGETLTILKKDGAELRVLAIISLPSLICC